MMTNEEQDRIKELFKKTVLEEMGAPRWENHVLSDDIVDALIEASGDKRIAFLMGVFWYQFDNSLTKNGMATPLC